MSAYQTGNAPNLYNVDGSPARQIGLDGREYATSGGAADTAYAMAEALTRLPNYSGT